MLTQYTAPEISGSVDYELRSLPVWRIRGLRGAFVYDVFLIYACEMSGGGLMHLGGGVQEGS